MAYLVLKKVQAFLLAEHFTAIRPTYLVDILYPDRSCCCACYRCLQNTDCKSKQTENASYAILQLKECRAMAHLGWAMNNERLASIT